MNQSLGSETLAARLLWIFAGAALLISIAGIYGLLAYNVSQRTRDIGLRMALGATRGNVIHMVLRQAVFLLGSELALGCRRDFRRKCLRSFLYGVVPYDAINDHPGVAVVAGLRPARQLCSSAPGLAHRSY